MKALLLLRSPGYGFLTGNIIKLENRFSETLTDDYINSAMPPEQAAIVISVRDEMHDILEAIDLQRRDLAEKLGMKRGSINSAGAYILQSTLALHSHEVEIFIEYFCNVFSTSYNA